MTFTKGKKCRFLLGWLYNTTLWYTYLRVAIYLYQFGLDFRVVTDDYNMVAVRSAIYSAERGAGWDLAFSLFGIEIISNIGYNKDYRKDEHDFCCG